VSRLVFVLIALCSGTASAQITGGADDDADPAAVALHSGGVILCSGVVASARVVLTAAHCVEGGAPPSVAFGADPAAGGASIAVAASRTHLDFDPDTFANDLAMIVLAEPTDVVPWPLRTAALSSALEGRAVRVIGYGLLAAGDDTPPRRRDGTAAIAAIEPGRVVLEGAPSQPCSGDSGGAVLLDDELIGVISSGAPSCTEGARATRVDAHHASFVLPFLVATADGAATPGARCWHDDNCAEGACVTADDDARLRYCSSPCADDADCPAEMRCDDGCRYDAPSPGTLGTSCTEAFDCVTEACTVTAGGARACTQVCVAGIPGTCPSGFACVPDPAGDDRCLPDTDAPGCGCASSRDPASALVLLAVLSVAGRSRRRRA